MEEQRVVVSSHFSPERRAERRAQRWWSRVKCLLSLDVDIVDQNIIIVVVVIITIIIII